ncbi:MAG: 2-oxo acid dehydrogenase subunit E2, partial [Haloferacaceae archaeon]
ASAETGEGPAASERGAVKASPRARQRADELGVDLGSVSGSGPQGSVTEADVEAAAEAGGGEAEAGGGPGIGAGPAPLTVAEERPFSGMRKTIADRLGESYRNAVHVTEHRTVDAEALFEATAAAKEALDADVSLPDLLLVALSAALDDHPAFNATFEDGTHRVYEEHNVGVAVDIDAGLVAPVIPDVGGKSLADVARARREVTRRALDGDYSMDDLANGTFTVTNLGVLGVESFDPVINPPQVAILGVDAIDERPVADDGDVTVRRQLPLDLSFDHRVVDGADAARFLESLAVHLEDPWPLLPESVRAARGGEREASETPKRYARSHSPEGLGGTVSSGDAEWTYGDGATPLEMFVGSLAGCLSVFLRLRADEEGVSLGAVDVAAEAHPKDGDVERVDVTATLESDAPDDRLDRIVDYAEQDCYVRRLVRDDVTVEVSWERA